MISITAEELQEHLQVGATIAAIDLGTKTIGLAVSDRGLSLANPRPVIKRTKFGIDADALISALEAENTAVLVIGLPFNMDGSEGPRAQATRAFARNFATRHEIPILFWDERLSTVAAERQMIENDMSRKKRAERIDSAAAAIILQGVLDRLRALRQP